VRLLVRSPHERSRSPGHRDAFSRGQVSSIYAGSVFQLQRGLRAVPDVELVIRDGDALITRARADLVALFLDDPAATHLLFVDADIRPGRQIWADLQSHLDQVEPATFHGDVATQFEAPVKVNDAA
jgi:hypothetical protein